MGRHKLIAVESQKINRIYRLDPERFRILNEGMTKIIAR